jgi:peptidoglycan hydrolase-like protein with peptidoglycan-binding domain
MGMQKFRAPALPLAPLEYDQQQLSQLIGVLRLYFTQLDSNVALQMDGIRLLNLATSGYNLPEGTVFRDGEYLKIVLPNIAYVEGVAGTGSVGSVTVTII